MGGACSRKRDQPVDDDSVNRGVSGRYCKSGSFKWLGNSFSRLAIDNELGKVRCPSLMELCIYKIREDIDKYNTFSMLPRDISQQIFNELVCSRCLTEASLEAFRDCALEDLDLGEYPGSKDSWMDVISSQGSSLLSVDLSGSEVTDSGLIHLKGCTNLQGLNLNYCDQISDHGLEHISGIPNSLLHQWHIKVFPCLRKNTRVCQYVHFMEYGCYYASEREQVLSTRQQICKG